MNFKFWGFVIGCLLTAGVLSMPGFAADDESKPKYKTKEVMAEALKGPLAKKVAAGDASAEEKKLLLEMFMAMTKNEPAKGDAESWKKKTTALVAAAKAAVAGDENAPNLLKEATNCKACHDVHK